MTDTGACSRLSYTFPVERLKRGHSFGNAQVYLTLDRNSDVIHEPQTTRLGMRDAWDQRYYLAEWKVELSGANGEAFQPVATTFAPDCQVTLLRAGKLTAEKKFILPFENNLLRSAHLLFTGSAALDGSTLRSRMLLPPGTTVAEAQPGGHRHVAIRYANGVAGLIWGSGGLRSLASRPAGEDRVECVAEFDCPPGKEAGLSFAYAHQGAPPAGAVYEAFAADAGSAASHLRRVKVIAVETALAIQAHLDTCRLWTPDPFITDGVNWAKINQLKDWQEYRRGPGFSNSPPSDVLVGRDTFWFLVGTNYYAQAWSRRLLEFWFRDGVEPNGKFIEYMLASSEPLFRDDYGLNVNDNTPLLIVAVHHYYSISGDRGFLDSVYAALIRSANYLLAQRNDDGLVWCRSRDVFVRGLCGWRNCTGNYELSGAVTEINAECQAAFALTAELAGVVGDRGTAGRFRTAAAALHTAINRHLRSDTKQNPFYLLTIDPDGKRRDDVTGDLLFPALFGIAPRPMARLIVEKLFGPGFWRGASGQAGGICTISPGQKGFEPRADPATYGLQGGVWPNLALWAARAAPALGRPDLLVTALRSTRLLADRSDFDRCNVTPGEFPEYFNADDLVQRGHPRSTFIHGSYLWAAWEGLLGLTPHARGLEVNPVLPPGWGWVALSRMPYRGAPLTLLAVGAGRTLYSTVRVKTKWKQVIVSAARQEEFRLESDAPVFWLVAGNEAIVAADAPARVRLLERATGIVAAELDISAGSVVRKKMSRKARP
ncbi:MAG: hypothetical protein JWM88_166 [Verrucomicrobia bacterium]|nr:hypothetical protein [Verrucomicrobiota bacterium]